MRKKLAILFALSAMTILMAVPATTAASTPGTFGFVNGYCTGHTVHATFKLIKKSGVYATKLTMTAQGQGFWNNKWHNEGTKSTFTRYDYTSLKTTYTDTIKWNPHESGGHRLKVVGRIWNGRTVVGTGSDVSGYCN